MCDKSPPILAAHAETKEQKQPFGGKCAKPACGHTWVVAYLPMDVSTFAKVAATAKCPMCGHDKVLVGSV